MSTGGNSVSGTWDFYVSYAGSDREWAGWIAWNLEQAGFPCLGPSELSSTPDNTETPLVALRRADRLVVVWSAESAGSSSVVEDLESARVAEIDVLFITVTQPPVPPAAQPNDVEVSIIGFDESRAARALAQAAEAFTRLPKGPPAFPRSRARAAPGEQPLFPRDLPSLQHPVHLSIVAGDIADTAADVAAFKYAGDFHGADLAVARKLYAAGVPERSLRPADLPGHAYLPTGRAIAADHALFVSTPNLVVFRYEEAKSLAQRVLEVLGDEAPETQHLAMTIHGPNFGLDAVEAFLSQIAGFLVALQLGRMPPALEHISIVERDADRVNELGAALESNLGQIPYASLLRQQQNPWTFRIGVASGERSSGRAIELIGRSPEDQPHVFAAFPFHMGDHFRYGIQRPAKSAGFLCEHFGEMKFTGDVLVRIKRQIETAAAVVAVITGANPNVFLEVGYAWGKGIPTILVVDETEELKFDVQGQRCVKYTDIQTLEVNFTEEIAGLKDKGVIRT